MNDPHDLDDAVGLEPDIDLTDKRKFKPNTACCWYMDAGACGAPLAKDDIAFCEKHRREADSYYRNPARRHR